MPPALQNWWRDRGARRAVELDRWNVAGSKVETRVESQSRNSGGRES